MRDSHDPLNANKTDRTWDQWYLLGYGVMVGEKPKYRVHGEAFYGEGQTMKLTRMHGEFEPKPGETDVPAVHGSTGNPGLFPTAYKTCEPRGN